MKKLASVTVILFLIIPPVMANDGDDSWHVSSGAAQCIISNLEAYIGFGSDPLVMFVDACPLVDPVIAMKSLQRNSFQPGFVESDHESELDGTIIYSLSDLKCLIGINFNYSDKIIDLPKSPCHYYK